MKYCEEGCRQAILRKLLSPENLPVPEFVAGGYRRPLAPQAKRVLPKALVRRVRPLKKRSTDWNVQGLALA